jgi:hypothetical protein
MVTRFFNCLCLMEGGLMVFRVTSQEETPWKVLPEEMHPSCQVQSKQVHLMSYYYSWQTFIIDLNTYFTSDFNEHTYFKFISLSLESKQAYVFMIRPPTFQLLGRLTNFHKIWYGYYTITSTVALLYLISYNWRIYGVSRHTLAGN